MNVNAFHAHVSPACLHKQYSYIAQHIYRDAAYHPVPNLGYARPAPAINEASYTIFDGAAARSRDLGAFRAVHLALLDSCMRFFASAVSASRCWARRLNLVIISGGFI